MINRAGSILQFHRALTTLMSKSDYATIWVKGINVQDDNFMQNIELTPVEFTAEELPENSEECD